ncbi:MAG: ABC transporter ATP-binding protein [Chromatiales bacterium]|jgi:ABC-2 type transport system ATP-binding protein|nr:ABC transporter ATP-binding protein [Chromatiales bacterium]
MTTDRQFSSLVQVEHLERSYGSLCAVADISFEVHRGEVLGFLGPNGAGKSTTMQVISGNLAPSAGRVFVNGVDILDEPRAAKAELGFLPEQPPLYHDLTVDEYLSYCARIHRIAREHRAGAIARTKERCGLGAVGRRLIGNLSKGYQQRVGLAQAIVHAPAVVILDEPTVGLDPIQIREIRGLIRELGGEHSVILSTHILPEVQAVCDRVLIMHRGRLVFDDTLAEMQQRAQMSWLVVGLRNPPPIAVLSGLDGVTQIEDLGGGRVRLRHAPEGGEFAERLALRAATEGWKLYELSRERRSLEEIFVDITTSDTSTDTSPREEAA